MLDSSTHSTDNQLSPEGRARRAAMLPRLEREVAARGRRRRIAQASGVVVPVLAIVVALLARGAGGPARPLQAPPIAIDPDTQPASDPDRALAVDLAPGDAGVPEERATGIEPLVVADASWHIIPRVHTADVSYIRPARGDEGLLDQSRYRGRPGVPTATDDELAAALRAAGRAAGVARTPDGARVLPDRPPTPAAM